MFKITSVDSFLSVFKMQTYDSIGEPEIEIQLSAPGVTNLETRIYELEQQVQSLCASTRVDRELMHKYPGLKEMHDQYQVMLQLVKDGEQSNVEP